jgi:hypothetical protein
MIAELLATLIAILPLDHGGFVKVFEWKINILKTERRPLYLKASPYRAVNTFHLGYKNQSVYAVRGASRCSHNT